MEYEKLVAVTGLPGLFEMINSRGDGAVLRSLDTGKTQFISGRIHHFSQLESIEVYTQRNNVNLIDVFLAMEKSGTDLPDQKDNNALKKYFTEVYPEMDFDRVYNSDMKKMVKWFDELKKHKIEIKLKETTEEVETPAEPEKEETPKEKNTTRKKK